MRMLNISLGASQAFEIPKLRILFSSRAHFFIRMCFFFFFFFFFFNFFFFLNISPRSDLGCFLFFVFVFFFFFGV